MLNHSGSFPKGGSQRALQKPSDLPESSFSLRSLEAHCLLLACGALVSLFKDGARVVGFGSVATVKAPYRQTTNQREAHTVDGRNPAPPKQPGNDDSSVNTNKAMVSHGVISWCEMDSVHPQYCGWTKSCTA